MIKRETLLYIVLAIVLALVPLMPFATDSNLTLLIGLFTVASMAASWNILAGFVGRVNLGHVAFFGIGSLVTRQLWLTQEWALAPAFAAGGLAAAIAALIVGAPALRLKGIYFAIGTLASAEALRLTVGSVLPRVTRLPGPALRNYELAPRYFLSLAVLVVIMATIYWLKNSKLGLGMMAVREDEAAARSIGINVFLHSLIAFVLSAFFAGLAGGTFAFFHVSYYPDFTFGPVWTFDAVLITFVGGIGTLAGPLIGALFFVLIRDVLASNLVNFHVIIFGAIFIFVVLVLPGGIIEISSRMHNLFKRETTQAPGRDWP